MATAARQARVVTLGPGDQHVRRRGESLELAPYDRHLYPNYLGNNPGNQGRNYAGMDRHQEPVRGRRAGKDAYLMVMASTGKTGDETASATCLDCAKIKLSAYITVIPVAQTPTAQATGTRLGHWHGRRHGRHRQRHGRHGRRRRTRGSRRPTRAPRSVVARPRAAPAARRPSSSSVSRPSSAAAANPNPTTTHLLYLREHGEQRCVLYSSR